MKALSTTIFLAASLMPAATLAQELPRANRPNIIFIMTRRPRGARHRRVRVARQPDAEPRSPGARRRAADERVRHQLDLHAEPRGDSDRPVLAPQRRDGVQPLRQLAHDGRAAAAAGRLLHRHDRQVAPRQRSRGLRPLGDPARPGRVHRIRSSTRRPARRRTPAATSPTSSPISRIDFIESRPREQAVLPDDAPQGAAPAVGAGRGARGAVRRRSGFPSRSRSGTRTRRAPTRCTRTSSASPPI